jgi:hypothetical protein
MTRMRRLSSPGSGSGWLPATARYDASAEEQVPYILALAFILGASPVLLLGCEKTGTRQEQNVGINLPRISGDPTDAHFMHHPVLLGEPR